MKQLKGLSSAFGESGLDPSILSLLGGGEVSDASSGTDLDGDKPILVDPKVLRQLVASGQISQEVADTIVTKGTKSNTGINIKGIDPRIIKALKRNPDLLKLAAEQFLGKDEREVKNTILQTLEGHLRAILGTMTVEEIYKDRERFAEQVS